MQGTYLLKAIHSLLHMKQFRLGKVAHDCNPSTLGGQGGWITQGQEFKTSLANVVKPVSTKNTKLAGRGGVLL